MAKYQSSLAKAQAAYISSTNAAEKGKYTHQIQGLKSLVALYSAGTDASVTNVQQFEAKLLESASRSKVNQNVVSAGSQVSEGANQLASASRKVSAQFSGNGTFKTGMRQVADGAIRLKQNSTGLASLQSGIGKLTSALFKLRDGSGVLLAGSQNLKNGISSAKNGSDRLISGSNKLAYANTKIKDGAARITYGVGLAGQKNEMENVMNKIIDDKNNKIADAFDKDFLFAAIILIALSFCGLFTDRRIEEKKL